MLHFQIGEVLDRFPHFRVGVVSARGLFLTTERIQEIDELILNAEEQVAHSIGGAELGEVPELKAWRKAYREFGVKSTSFRSSVERLVKLVQRGRGIPKICNLVDLYNTVSIVYRMPVGADDLDCIVQPMGFRYGREGDTFIALGDSSQTPDPPVIGEVVYADAEKCLCRRWNWYQDARSAINVERTKDAIITIQSIDAGTAYHVEEACEYLADLLRKHCQAECTWRVADSGQPTVEFCV